MRIAQLIETRGPGGAEKIFLSLIKGMLERDYEIFPCLTGQGWLYDEVVKAGLKPLILSTSGSFDINFLKGLVKFIKNKRIEIIHSHLPGANLYAGMAGMLTGIKVISTFHGLVDLENLRKGKFFKLKGRLIGFCSDRIVAVSEFLKKQLTENKWVPEKKVVIIHNGIDITKYTKYLNTSKARLKRSFGFSDKDLIIGKIGNIRKSKGYEYFLKACSILLRDIPEIKILVVGHAKKQEDLNALKRLSEELGINDKVMFTGYIDEITEILPIIDVYVLASLNEGFSISTVEAMATGIPVVCTRSGGPEEIVINERNGLLVPPCDPVAIAEAIKRIVNDKILAFNIVKEGIKTAERFSLTRMLDNYENLYREVKNYEAKK